MDQRFDDRRRSVISMTISRKVAVRAFSGLSGSPLAKVNEAVVEQSANPAAIRARARRAANAAKLADIKESLRIPLEERKQTERDKQTADAVWLAAQSFKPKEAPITRQKPFKIESANGRRKQEQDGDIRPLPNSVAVENEETLDFLSFTANRGWRKVKGEGVSSHDAQFEDDDYTESAGPTFRVRTQNDGRKGTVQINQQKLERILQNAIDEDGEQYRCNICGHTDSWLSSVRLHVESSIESEWVAANKAKAKQALIDEAMSSLERWEVPLALPTPDGGQLSGIFSTEKHKQGPHLVAYRRKKVAV